MSRYEDSFDDYGEQEQPTTRECKPCGKSGLHWEHDGDAWVLMEGKYKVHKCDPKKAQAAAADDFEVIE